MNVWKCFLNQKTEHGDLQQANETFSFPFQYHPKTAFAAHRSEPPRTRSWFIPWRQSQCYICDWMCDGHCKTRKNKRWEMRTEMEGGGAGGWRICWYLMVVVVVMGWVVSLGGETFHVLRRGFEKVQPEAAVTKAGHSEWLMKRDSEVLLVRNESLCWTTAQPALRQAARYRTPLLAHC